MDGDQWFSVDSANVLSETIDQEVMIIDMRLGNYYSLNGVAATIWNALAEPRRLGDVVDVVCQHYSGTADEISASVRRFVGDLAAEQLVAQHSDAPAAAAPSSKTAPAATLPFEAPRLEKYTDMQALLLVDPIHDVDVLGWPQKVRSS